MRCESMTKQKNIVVSNAKRGFTLIELLIVIAILGVLAVVVLVAINPVQQLARTRDSGRKSSVTQLGHAVSAYYTARNGVYPSANSSWISGLSTAGELASVPAVVGYSASGYSTCSTNSQNSFCYGTSASTAIVYTTLESDVEKSKCSSGYPYFVYDAQQGRGGLVCTASDPTAGGGWTFNATQ